MKQYNLWKSLYTGCVYEMPLDFLPDPRAKGWELVGTIEKED